MLDVPGRDQIRQLVGGTEPILAVAARSRDDEPWTLPGRTREEAQQRQRRAVGPVHVLHHDNHRPAAAPRVELSCHSVEKPRASDVGRQLAQAGELDEKRGEAAAVRSVDV